MNAIILAAGIGTRLLPVTSDLPKPLIRINDEPIIERQILYLKATGINEIFIVVGYKADHFEYLIKKYGVTLVHNPHYKEYNNLYSLHLCRDVLGDSYIIEGDVFFSKNFLINTLDKSTYFSGIKKSLTGEWILNHRQGHLKEIIIYEESKSYYPDGAFIMSGISYWTINDAVIIKKRLEEIMKKEDLFLNYQQQYWDFIIYENFNKFSIQVHEIATTDWHEIDTFLHLKEIGAIYSIDVLKYQA